MNAKKKAPAAEKEEKFDPTGSVKMKLLQETFGKPSSTWSATLAESFKFSVTAGWISFILYLTATTFDGTELKAIAGILLGLGGFRGITKYIESRLGGA